MRLRGNGFWRQGNLHNLTGATGGRASHPDAPGTRVDRKFGVGTHSGRNRDSKDLGRTGRLPGHGVGPWSNIGFGRDVVLALAECRSSSRSSRSSLSRSPSASIGLVWIGMEGRLLWLLMVLVVVMVLLLAVMSLWNRTIDVGSLNHCSSWSTWRSGRGQR